MNHRLILSGLAFLILVSLLAGPALAATVTCPPTCSCLLPAEAAKINTPGLCGGKQQVCAEEGKTVKYCYARPVTATTTMPQLIATGFHPVPTTVPAFVKCSPDCSCEYEPFGEMTNRTLCGGTQYLCGMDHKGVPMYCYVRPPPRLVTGPESVTPSSHAGQVTPVPTTQLPPKPTVPPSESPSAIAAIQAMPAMIISPSMSIPPSLPVPAVRRAEPVLQPGALAIPSPRPTEPVSFLSVIGSFFSSRSPTPPSSSSSTRLISCNGTLTNIMVDPGNCGGCGILCEGRCTGGVCTDTAPGMQAPCGIHEIMCSGTCRNYLSDSANCGRCDHQCSPDQGCCMGVCTELSTRMNCGACGTTCEPSERCSGGQCVCGSPAGAVCPAGASCCHGQCTNLQTDAANCGTCGNACGTGETCCSGRCVNTQNDANHCGTCTHTCPEGYSCDRGGCINTESDGSNCGGRGIRCNSFNELCCDGRCITFSTDSRNCGSCGRRCAGANICVNGHCIDLASDPDNCGGREITCGSSRTCCSGTCVNTLSDNDNCDWCGNTCHLGTQCCDGRCKDFQTDRNNCGACGNICGNEFDCYRGECISVNSDDNCGSVGASCNMCQHCENYHCTSSFLDLLPCIAPAL